jgi:hypothetical protein
MRPLPCHGAAPVLLALTLICAARPAAARFCLPPLFEDGQRLHPLTDVRVMWLDPLLRQHEICWRERAGEVRIALFGDSAVFGFPLPADQSFSAVINNRFAAAGVPAHVFNLAWVFTYQPRDALILHEALAYAPDVIVDALTLSNFLHVAPLPWPPPMVRFFELNTDALARLTTTPPPGLAEPFEDYRPVAERSVWLVATDRLHQLGSLAHVAAHQHASSLARRLGTEPRPEPSPRRPRIGPYDCQATLKDNATMYTEFERWNPLEDLANIRARTGKAVLVINWPTARDPNGDCYNRRYGAALLAEYNRWLSAETTRLGLPYLDLHDLLEPTEFFDTLHVTPAGHQRIAERVAQVLEPMLRARLAVAAGGGARATAENRP